MGNTTYHGVISNATEYNVRYRFGTSKIQLQTREVDSSWDANVGVKGEYKNEVGAKVGKDGVEIEAKYGPSAEITGGVGYKRNTKDNHTRVNISGFIIVPPNNSVCQGIDNVIPEAEKDYYLSIIVECPSKGSDVTILMDNVSVSSERDIRKCIWQEGGRFNINTVCPNPKNWRFDKNQGQRRNYPPGITCTQCKKSDRCKADCAELYEYGGLS